MKVRQARGNMALCLILLRYTEVTTPDVQLIRDVQLVEYDPFSSFPGSQKFRLISNYIPINLRD